MKGLNDIDIRIVQLPFLSNFDVLTMLTASEPMNLCTQSLIESMCAGKVLIYDTPGHKLNLYADLIDMCNVKSSTEAAELLVKLKTSTFQKNLPEER